MKVKKEYIILALVIIGLSAYLVMRRTDRTLYRLPEIPPVAKNEITRLQLTKAGTQIILNKKDTHWYIAPREYPADNKKLEVMLENIADLNLTALVAESKNYNRYDLEEEKKINVRAWRGDSLGRDIDVGKTASSFRHTFVKLAGDDRVFHALGNLHDAFDQSVDSLREKTVLAFKPDEIQEIEITKAPQSLIFARVQTPAGEETRVAAKNEVPAAAAPKSVWQTADGRPGDDAALSQMLSALSGLRCEKFIDDRNKADFNAPVYTIRLKGAQEYTLSLFAKPKADDKDTTATSSASDYPFVLGASQVDRLMRDPEALVKKPAASETKPEPKNSKTMLPKK